MRRDILALGQRKTFQELVILWVWNLQSEFQIYLWFLCFDARQDFWNYIFSWYPVSWKVLPLKEYEKAWDKQKGLAASYFALCSCHQCPSFWEHSHCTFSEVTACQHPASQSPQSWGSGHLLTEALGYKHANLLLCSLNQRANGGFLQPLILLACVHSHTFLPHPLSLPSL